MFNSICKARVKIEPKYWLIIVAQKGMFTSICKARVKIVNHYWLIIELRKACSPVSARLGSRLSPSTG